MFLQEQQPPGCVAKSLACPLLGGWGRIYHLDNEFCLLDLVKQGCRVMEALKPEQSLFVSLSSHLIRR